MFQIQRLKGLLIALFIILVAGLYALIYFVPNIGDTFQKTYVANYDSIQVYDIQDCYIIRDETVYFSKNSGAIKYAVEEGERIKKNSSVLTLDSSVMSQDVSKEVQIINERISNINSGDTIFENDIKNIETAISQIIDELIEAKEQKNIVKVKELEDRLSKIVEKKEILVKHREEALLNVKSIDVSSTIVASILNQNIDVYNSANPGIISYYIDGYETDFNPASMYLLKKDAMDSIDGDVSSLARDYAHANEPLYKIVNAHEWYAAAWIKNDIIDYYQVGNEVVFNLPDGDISGKVHDIMQDDKESLVIIKFNDYHQDFWKLRKIKARIVAKNFEGLKIANTSIVIKHGETGVFVVDQELNDVFVPVKVIGSNDTFSIVESNYFFKQTEDGLIKVDTLDLYDEVVTNGRSKIEGGI